MNKINNSKCIYGFYFGSSITIIFGYVFKNYYYFYKRGKIFFTECIWMGS